MRRLRQVRFNVTIDDVRKTVPGCTHKPLCYKEYRANPPAKDLGWTFATS